MFRITPKKQQYKREAAAHIPRCDPLIVELEQTALFTQSKITFTNTLEFRLSSKDFLRLRVFALTVL